MEEFLLTPQLAAFLEVSINIVSATMGLIAIFFTLKLFDYIRGGEERETYFKTWINKCESSGDTKSLALYYSARYIGTCLYYAFVLT